MSSYSGEAAGARGKRVNDSTRMLSCSPHFFGPLSRAQHGALGEPGESLSTERSWRVLAIKEKGHAALATWPSFFMPATTYAPTHFRVQYHRPCGA